MLEETYKSIKEEADQIDWKQYNKNDLFYEYIKYEGKPIQKSFYAAILCRYWGYSGRVYYQCNRHVPFEDCFDIVVDQINYVIKHRVWENPKSSLYGDKSQADKAFHIALKRQRGIVLQKLCTSKRLANFNTMSIDQLHEEYNDQADGLFDFPELEDKYESLSGDASMIQYIASQPPRQRVILDKICFSDWSSISQVITNLKKLTQDDFDYYNKVYGIPREDYFKMLLDYIKFGPQKIKFDVDKTLYLTKKNYIG